MRMNAIHAQTERKPQDRSAHRAEKYHQWGRKRRFRNLIFPLPVACKAAGTAWGKNACPARRFRQRSRQRTHHLGNVGLIFSKGRCSIPDVCIDERRVPLFIARATLRDLIAGLEARAVGGAAR